MNASSRVSFTSESNIPPGQRTHLLRNSLLFACCLVGFFAILFGVVHGPQLGGLQGEASNSWMQSTRSIALSMFQYSIDHDGKYPEGESSTEVFQKLLDGKYITDSGVFYIPFPGKTKAIQGHILKPENVCFDVTCCMDQSASDDLPIVFMTGYKVNYVPGGSAVPLIKPYPPFGSKPRTWVEWWDRTPSMSEPVPGIAVCYKSNTAKFIPLAEVQNGDGSIQNFIPSAFDPAGKIYRQLTPDGLVSP